MSRRAIIPMLTLSSILFAGPTFGGQLSSVPLSHAGGMQSVVCHFVNVGTKPIVVESFRARRLFGATIGTTSSGACTGFAPWTINPGSGCSSTVNAPNLCDQPNGCYCQVEFTGSPKSIRGALLGTPTGSTTALTAELR